MTELLETLKQLNNTINNINVNINVEKSLLINTEYKTLVNNFNSLKKKVVNDFKRVRKTKEYKDFQRKQVVFCSYCKCNIQNRELARHNKTKTHIKKMNECIIIEKQKTKKLKNAEKKQKKYVKKVFKPFLLQSITKKIKTMDFKINVDYLTEWEELDIRLYGDDIDSDDDSDSEVLDESESEED